MLQPYSLNLQKCETRNSIDFSAEFRYYNSAELS